MPTFIFMVQQLLTTSKIVFGMLCTTHVPTYATGMSGLQQPTLTLTGTPLALFLLKQDPSIYLQTL